ncbi:hypothetical protein [Thiovibrio frasassiensis]|uniref:Uncharacterized protein n=1 Tax=Thiovibrio frasassiensis TaxID=2984131 RepID=A0A9X4MFT4_9BACT|nr:hypothetical protein [Thiovibrio frasassiensis]MDG4475593.1 hypothetical protein [Thiovibrio frasassiensis]
MIDILGYINFGYWVSSVLLLGFVIFLWKKKNDILINYNRKMPPPVLFNIGIGIAIVSFLIITISSLRVAVEKKNEANEAQQIEVRERLFR